MTTAQKQSAINRFNDRLNQIGKAFGKDSYQYTQYQRKLELLVGSKNMTKSGRAGRGKKVVENISDEDIKAMDQQSTAGKIKQRIREDISEEEGISSEAVSSSMIKQRAREIGETRAMMDEIGSALSDALAKWRDAHKQHGKLTYAQINEALTEWDGTKTDRADAAKRLYEKHFGEENEEIPFETSKKERTRE